MGSRPIYFTQDCLVCGRPMRVRAELIDEPIQCGHCAAQCVGGQSNDDIESPWRRHHAYVADAQRDRLQSDLDLKS